MNVEVDNDLKVLLKDVLQLGDRADSFDRETRLLGAIPEFDSMAVVSLVTAIEENYGIVFDDEDITADNFETLGSLAEIVEQRLDE